MSVVPDSIEPVEEWRTWNFDGSHLLSHNGATWLPGEAHKATCNVSGVYVWALKKRGGMTCEQAADQTNSLNNQISGMTYQSTVLRHWLYAPRVEPPKGYGYTLEAVQHDAPHINCSCGIYAGRTAADCPAGVVLGKVKMWGTIVPGTKGSRAQFAYPSELHVPARLADDPALLAYGVPVVALTEQQAAANVSMMTALPHQRMPWMLRAAIAINLAGAVANFTLIGLRTWT